MEIHNPADALRAWAFALLDDPNYCARLREVVVIDTLRQEAVYEAIDAFARRYSVSTKTVRRWLVLGLPHERPSKRLVRIPVEKASAWIAQGKAREPVRRRTIPGKAA